MGMGRWIDERMQKKMAAWLALEVLGETLQYLVQIIGKASWGFWQTYLGPSGRPWAPELILLQVIMWREFEKQAEDYTLLLHSPILPWQLFEGAYMFEHTWNISLKKKKSINILIQFLTPEYNLIIFIKGKRLFFVKCNKYLQSKVSSWRWIWLKAFDACVSKPAILLSSHTMKSSPAVSFHVCSN